MGAREHQRKPPGLRLDLFTCLSLSLSLSVPKAQMGCETSLCVFGCVHVVGCLMVCVIMRLQAAGPPAGAAFCLKSPKTSKAGNPRVVSPGFIQRHPAEDIRGKTPDTRRLNTALQLKTHRTILTLTYKFNQQFAAPCNNVLVPILLLVPHEHAHVLLGVKIIATVRKTSSCNPSKKAKSW